jgi:hypothetical protein
MNSNVIEWYDQIIIRIAIGPSGSSFTACDEYAAKLAGTFLWLVREGFFIIKKI